MKPSNLWQEGTKVGFGVSLSIAFEHHPVDVILPIVDFDHQLLASWTKFG